MRTQTHRNDRNKHFSLFASVANEQTFMEVSSGRGFTAPGCQDCLGGEVVVVGMGGVLEVGLSRSDSTHSNAKPDRGLD